MRIKKLKRLLAKNDMFPYLITDLYNIRYLTGYSGTNAYLIIDEKKSFFISDSRYEEYAKSLLPGSIDFVLQDGGILDAMKACFGKMGCTRLFIESHNMPLSLYLELKKRIRKVRILPGEINAVNEMRMVKDDNEVDLLRKAAAIGDSCFEHLLGFVKAGMTEWDVAVEIDYFYKKNGCTACSFDPIVASGTGSSMPHYMPSMDKKIASGDVLLIDMGCLYKGYNSDMTRTIFLDKIENNLDEIYKIVFTAQQEAVRAVKPGASTVKLDSVARDIITGSGYGDNFGHGLGHGVGIEIHEIPALKKNADMKLKKNMVVTVEPGIYIPGRGGVRIEDMVLVTSKGQEVLTKSSKELTII